MFRKSKQLVRIAILLMLFQSVAPAFIPVVAQEIPNNKTATLHVQHNSIVAPLFLKENEEKENSEFLSVSQPAPLLDLNTHSHNLTASHSNKYSDSVFCNRYPQPSRHTLFCSFLI